jgi:hypothetical protein
MSSPQEDLSLRVPREFLNFTIEQIKAHCHGLPVDLFFNLDEVGISDWEDRKPKTVVISISMKDEKIHRGMDRSLQHVSVIVCVTATDEN